MAATDFAKALAVALEIAGSADRGLIEGNSHDIREMMSVRNVPDDQFENVLLLVDALGGFAMDVRAAALKGKPIIPVVGEDDLPD